MAQAFKAGSKASENTACGLQCGGKMEDIFFEKGLFLHSACIFAHLSAGKDCHLERWVSGLNQ
ncbi:hypothetical protein K3G63_06410 [Hymenobacter sp. HSC-4F20]|uniref:hypothetical protein n=1 Tax=Hymenobacter sp. HSC-4F20 TaxID=2864135 RepID=UPI001C72E98B|nr:hypothetical protein [Hymenobacter sp. HSC-4F20]MBX0290062.1 hypothetical protein [Hymenobacter sp. HSC-4F20]